MWKVGLLALAVIALARIALGGAERPDEAPPPRPDEKKSDDPPP